MRTPSRYVATSSSSRRRGRVDAVGRMALVACAPLSAAVVDGAYCGAAIVQATDPWCQNQCCFSAAVCGWYEDETKSVRMIAPPAICVSKYGIIEDAWCEAVTCCASAFCEWRYATRTTTDSPTEFPTDAPTTASPSARPTTSRPLAVHPSAFPTRGPSPSPSVAPTSPRPSRDPSPRPSASTVPTSPPSAVPTASISPSVGPSSSLPSSIPTDVLPSGAPSRVPTVGTTATTVTKSVTDADGNVGSETSCVGATTSTTSATTTTTIELSVTYDYAVLSKVGSNLGAALSKLEGAMLDAVELSCEASSSPGARIRRRRERRRRGLDDVGGNGTSSSSIPSPFRASTLPYDSIKTSCDESEESNVTDVQCAVVSGGFTATYPSSSDDPESSSSSSIDRDEALQSYLVWVKDRMTDGSFVASAVGADDDSGLVGLIYRGNEGSGTGGTGTGIVPDGRDGNDAGPGVSALNQVPEPQDDGDDKLSTWGGVFIAGACAGTVLIAAALIRRRKSTTVEVTEDYLEAFDNIDEGYADEENSRSPLGATPPRSRRYDYSSSYLEVDAEEPSVRVIYEPRDANGGADGISTLDGESSGYDSTTDALASIIEDVDYSLEYSLETSSGPRTRNSSFDTVPGSLGTVPENEVVTSVSTSDVHSCNSATCRICRDRDNDIIRSMMPRTQFLHMREEGMESFEVRWSLHSSQVRSGASSTHEPNTMEL